MFSVSCLVLNDVLVLRTFFRKKGRAFDRTYAGSRHRSGAAGADTMHIDGNEFSRSVGSSFSTSVTSCTALTRSIARANVEKIQLSNCLPVRETYGP